MVRGRTVAEDTLQVNSVLVSGELEKVEMAEKPAAGKEKE